MHLPVKRLQDNKVMMKVFVPHGVTCFSGTTFICISQFENWQAVLLEAGKRAYPRRNPDTVIFHRVHSAIEEVSSLHDPVTKHFILADSEEQECTRTVVFAVFTPAMSSLELVIGLRWPKCGIFLTCVEARKGGLSTTTISDPGTTRCPCIMAISLPAMSVVIATPPQADRPETDIAQESVKNAPTPVHGEAAGCAIRRWSCRHYPKRWLPHIWADRGSFTAYR